MGGGVLQYITNVLLLSGQVSLVTLGGINTRRVGYLWDYPV